MTTTKPAKGSCLCGSIKLEATSMSTSLGTCHCGMCRKWSAGPFFSVDCGSDIKIDGSEHLAIYDSSQWAERGFCKNCGTNLFYKLKETQHYYMSAELFNEPDLNFDHQVFIDEKPKYYTFSNQTKDMTGPELFAAFAPKE